jgi:hypothetical protein
MLIKREISEGVYDMVLLRLHDKVKADCLNPNVRRWNVTLVGTAPIIRHLEPWVIVSLSVRLA